MTKVIAAPKVNKATMEKSLKANAVVVGTNRAVVKLLTGAMKTQQKAAIYDQTVLGQKTDKAQKKVALATQKLLEAVGAFDTVLAEGKTSLQEAVKEMDKAAKAAAKAKAATAKAPKVKAQAAATAPAVKAAKTPAVKAAKTPATPK